MWISRFTGVTLEAQQELFENRYVQIVAADRPGWSDEESCAFAIEMYQRQLAAVGVHGGDLLELGCGRGNIALAFARRGYEVTGVDFSPTAVQWAKDFALAQDLEAGFVEADLRRAWPFDDESFDVVIDANCLHFFHGDERSFFLSEAFRVLRSDGYLMMSTMVNQPEPEHWEQLGYDPNARISRMNGVVMNYHAEPAEVMAELMTAGFRVMSSVTSRKEHDLMWATLRKAQ